LARSPLSPYKPLLYAFGLLLAWWVAPAALKGLLRTLLYEFQAPSWTALSSLGDLQSYRALRPHSKDDLIEAGRDLARLNAAYQLRLQQAEAQARELRRMESLLDLPPLPAVNYVSARVIRRDLDTWWHHITIQRGADARIQPGDAVVYRGGVVGRVKEVHAFTSTVELISSATFRVAAHVEGDLRPITYVGVPAPAFNEPSGTVSNVPPDITTSAGAPVRVVSSRLGGVFPDGLTIGHIDRLQLGSDGLFQSGHVKLNPNLLSVHEVAVLVPAERLVERAGD